MVVYGFEFHHIKELQVLGQHKLNLPLLGWLNKCQSPLVSVECVILEGVCMCIFVFELCMNGNLLDINEHQWVESSKTVSKSHLICKDVIWR